MFKITDFMVLFMKTHKDTLDKLANEQFVSATQEAPERAETNRPIPCEKVISLALWR